MARHSRCLTRETTATELSKVQLHLNLYIVFFCFFVFFAVPQQQGVMCHRCITYFSVTGRREAGVKTKIPSPTRATTRPKSPPDQVTHGRGPRKKKASGIALQTRAKCDDIHLIAMVSKPIALRISVILAAWRCDHTSFARALSSQCKHHDSICSLEFRFKGLLKGL